MEPKYIPIGITYDGLLVMIPIKRDWMKIKINGISGKGMSAVGARIRDRLDRLHFLDTPDNFKGDIPTDCLHIPHYIKDKKLREKIIEDFVIYSIKKSRESQMKQLKELSKIEMCGMSKDKCVYYDAKGKRKRE